MGSNNTNATQTGKEKEEKDKEKEEEEEEEEKERNGEDDNEDNKEEEEDEEKEGKRKGEGGGRRRSSYKRRKITSRFKQPNPESCQIHVSWKGIYNHCLPSPFLSLQQSPSSYSNLALRIYLLDRCIDY